MKKSHKLRVFCFALAILLTFIYPLEATVHSREGIAIFILDNSGSMDEELQGKNKLVTAKETIKEVVNNPSLNAIDMGLIELGGHCEVKELVKPGLNNREKLTSTVDRVQPRPYRDASTPIAEAIYEASEIIRKYRNKNGEVPARIVLISDGEANCMKKEEFPLRPCDMVASLKNQDILFDLTLVNYGFASKKDKELECIARLSDNSIVIDPDDITSTSTMLRQHIDGSIDTQPQPIPEPKKPLDLQGIAMIITALATLIGTIWIIVVYFLDKNDPPGSNRNDSYY
ncbi:MAG: vWA domain-containing protein [Cyanobacteria bacterium J06621_8]